MDPSTDENQDFGFFKLWLLISQLLGAVSIALVSAWCGQYLGGFAWQSNPKLQFNYHPFFMVLGMIFCYGEAILVYRVLRNHRKKYLKVFHIALHTVAFVFTIVALKAVFDYHSLTASTHLYSFHSWLGLAAVILFALQYLCGILAFLSPYVPKTKKSKYLPSHAFFGLAIFVMAVASAVVGIIEKILYMEGWKYKNLGTSALVGNFLACCLVLYALLIVYMVANPHFRRKPLPEEVQLLNDTETSND